MVFLSILRQAAARIPLIKFRGKRGPDIAYKLLPVKGTQAKAVAAPSTPAPKAAQIAAPKAAPKAAPQPQQGKAAMTVSKGATIEDWQLPTRYRRLPFEIHEIDYINCGGDPSLGIAKKPPPKKPSKPKKSKSISK